MAALTATRTRLASASLAGSLSGFVVLGLILAASLLRLVNQQAFAWVPDHYERIIEAKEILSGHLPNSVIYPPGASLLLSPFVALFGPTERAMQALTIASGVALIPLAYVWASRSTGDKTAATLFAGGCAIAPALVILARGGYVDSLGTLLIVGAFFLVPNLKSRSVSAFVCFGLLLALLFNIRPTNVFVVPSLALYWLCESGTSWRPASVIRVLLSKEILITAVALAVPCGVSMLAGNWYGGAYGGLVTFDRFFENLAAHWLNILGAWINIAIFGVPVALGVAELWRTRRPLVVALVSFLAIWPVVHSPFLFADGRYMAPATVVLLFLAAKGVSAGVGRTWTGPRAVRYWCLFSLATACALFGVVSGMIVSRWGELASESDATLAAEMRPILSELPPEALMISAVTRAFSEDGFSFEYVDLFDESVAFKDRSAGVENLRVRTREALAEGRHVYYLYSHMETDNRLFGGIWASFHAYFGGLDSEFNVTEVGEAEHKRGGREPWVLFELSTAGREDDGTPPASPVADPSP